MLTRRDVLKAGAILPSAGFVMPIPAFASAPPVLVVRESDVTESRQFADALQSRAVAMIDAGRDPGAAWRTISAHLRDYPASTIAGCTRDATAFVLRELARSVGIDVARVTTHRYHADGFIEHRFPFELRQRDVAALRTACWPTIASMMLTDQGPGAERGYACRIRTRRPVDSPGYVVSWTLVPA